MGKKQKTENQQEKAIFDIDLEYYLRYRALEEASQAVNENSYGVGGVMVNLKDRNIIHKMHNTVISKENETESSRLKDPTAHGERQLVDWYFENRDKLNLPNPDSIAIITTLDPCCMCTGSILSAGFKVIVAALDDQAGIDYNYKHEFSPFTGKELKLAKDSFIYPETTGNSGRSAYGKIPDCFIGKVFYQETVEKCSQVFNEGADRARNIVNKNEVPEDKLKNIENLDKNDPIVKMLKEYYPNALEYKATDSKNPDEGLAEYLIEAANEDKKNGGDGDAVAFLDKFGNLLMCKGGNKKASPIRTAYMETIRTYQEIRYKLTAKNNDALKYLCDPKYGIFVFVRGFDKGTQCFADMGAYGSSILGSLNNPDNLQYILPRIEQNELEHFIKGMPPRYRDLIAPKCVENKDLINKVRTAFEE